VIGIGRQRGVRDRRRVVMSRQWTPPIIGFCPDDDPPAMINRPVAQMRDYAIWLARLPQATGLIFAARSSTGRSIKIFLFGVGAVLPLGSLIWAMLFWHGRGLRHRRLDRQSWPPRRLSPRRA
jgi:hypothetical protein